MKHNKKLKQLKDLLLKKEVVMNKDKSQYEKTKSEYDNIKYQIAFFTDYESVKPQILMNQGRDKKYVYCQIYYQSSRTNSKKKSYRFLIGTMDDNSKRKIHETYRLCKQMFFDKYIITEM